MVHSSNGYQRGFMQPMTIYKVLHTRIVYIANAFLLHRHRINKYSSSVD